MDHSSKAKKAGRRYQEEFDIKTHLTKTWSVTKTMITNTWEDNTRNCQLRWWFQMPVKEGRQSSSLQL